MLPGGRVAPARTVLVSDFLLVQVAGEGWIPFRDVFERDGQQVRDRQDRLAAIFLSGSRDAFAQALKIMNEGARYNLGNVSRNINIPTLPLPFITPRYRDRLRFTLARPDPIAPGVVVAFKEVEKPTIIRTANNRDLPVEGRLWIDPDTGTIYRTEVEASDTALEAHMAVTYRQDPGLGLWVPERMEDRIRRRADLWWVYGTATYAKFRRFQVTTSEEIAK